MIKPLISIVVPVYNVSKYVEQCIESLLKQTMKEIEIIVVDDCGTDDSIKKIEKMALLDARIRIIYNDENQGLGESRNIGLKYVTAEYVSFLDSDDWVADDFCEKLYNACIKNSADIAVSDFIYYYNKNDKKRGWTSNYNFMSEKTVIVNPKDKQYSIYACSVCAKIFRTDLFRQYNIKFPKGLYYEDVPVTFFTTMIANKLVLVKNTQLFYRQREGSIMATTNASKKPLDIIKIYEYILHFLSVNNVKYKKEYQQILENFAVFNIYGYYLAVHPLYKDEFWKSMKKFFKKIHMKDNPYLTFPNRKLYYYVCYGDKILQTMYVKLFDFVPLLKYIKAERSILIKLFGIIPLFGKKWSEQKKKYSVFGILFWKTKLKNKNRRDFLFGFIPIIKVKSKS